MEIPAFLSIYAFFGFGIAIAIVAIAYMLGRALKKPELVGWANAERDEILKTAILFIAILSLEGIFSLATNYILEEIKAYEHFHLNKDSPPTLAIAELFDKIINFVAFPTIIKTAEVVHQMEFFKGAAESWALPGVIDVKIKAYAGIGYREPPLKWALTLLTLVYTSLNAQRIGYYLLYYLGQILLLGALAFRIFKPIREGSDHVISMVLGYSIFFPFFTLLFLYVFDETLFLSQGKHLINAEAWEKGENISEWMKEVGSNIIKFLFLGFPPYLYSSQVIYKIYDSVTSLAVVGFILPTFSLLIANASIKNLLKVLKMGGFGGLSI